MFSIIKDFLMFVISRKKYWLMPVVLVLLIFGVFIVIGQSSSTIAPFIYAVF
jgi:hypothetical protein|tara:strand:+ start:633 stop:788 length:156 start_codon:yes stop_codon:yes gene_type:complete